ncbi:MAG: hypothetical protein LBN26_04200 [Christensenellaceae bacterium]|jgi:hypothetical protein|nr:hypothetical protein [Christensenellaceae bacterium]
MRHKSFLFKILSLLISGLTIAVTFGCAKKESIVPSMLSLEIINEESKTPNHYIEQAEEFLAHNQKERALQILKEGIFALGGSQAPESAEVLDQWWETLITDAHDDKRAILTEKELEQATYIANISGWGGYSFFFAEEAFPNKLLSYIAAYYNDCYFLDVRDLSANTAYPIFEKENDFVVVSADVVERLTCDLFQIDTTGIVEKGQEEARQWYTDWDVEQKNLAEDNPGYEKYINRVDVDIYFQNFERWDDGDPIYFIEDYAYLGNDMFFVANYSVSNGRYDDEPDKIVEKSSRLIIKRSDNEFGFAIVSAPKIKDGWGLPNNMVMVTDMPQVTVE